MTEYIKSTPASHRMASPSHNQRRQPTANRKQKATQLSTGSLHDSKPKAAFISNIEYIFIVNIYPCARVRVLFLSVSLTLST